MSNVVVIGSQWGDEGKGKLVDWLADKADAVVRFQGGNNAGHTLVINGKTYKLSVLPSSIIRKDKLSLIGNGVVLDPWAFIKEIDLLREQSIQISPENLKVSEQTTLILPFHQNLDKAREISAKAKKIGTTGRGIGPAYEDKVGRRAIRFGDLANIDTVKERLNSLATHHNALLRGMGIPEFSEQSVLDKLKEIIPQLLPYSAPVWKILNDLNSQGKQILFEGAQGTMLDIDHGTFPFVTSSNTVSAQASSGSGLGPNSINHILGITKAYTTRVGKGPFPTELFDEVGDVLSSKGKEIGTVTGRDRRCGWFDSILVKKSVQINGISSIALTKLDVLTGLANLKICTSYELDNEIIDYFPSSQADQERIKPVYEELVGWDKDIRKCQTRESLPSTCEKYLQRIEQLIGVPISIISTSPERTDTIVISEPFQS